MKEPHKNEEWIKAMLNIWWCNALFCVHLIRWMETDTNMVFDGWGSQAIICPGFHFKWDFQWSQWRFYYIVEKLQVLPLNIWMRNAEMKASDIFFEVAPMATALYIEIHAFKQMKLRMQAWLREDSNWGMKSPKQLSEWRDPETDLVSVVKLNRCVPHIALSILNKLFSNKYRWYHISVSKTARFTQTADSNPFLEQLYLIGSFIKDCFLSSVSHRNQFVHNPLNSGTPPPVWGQGLLPT